MPLVYSTGRSLFDTKHEVLVNTINCAGAMGKGVALEFRTRFPEIIPEYKKLCERGYFSPGRCHWWKMETKGLAGILMFATKDHWRDPSRLEWIETGCQDMRRIILQRDLESVGTPWMGCGNGGLDRNNVRPMLEKYLGDLDCTVEVCG